MPGYRVPKIQTMPAEPSTDPIAQSFISDIVINNSNGHQRLSNVPIVFGSFPSTVDLSRVLATMPLYNSNIPAIASQVACFTWAVYGFNCGHFVSSIQSKNLPFDILLAADVFLAGRAMFQEFTSCSAILPGIK